MRRRVKLGYVLGVVAAFAGCGATPDSRLAPEAPRRELPREEARRSDGSNGPATYGEEPRGEGRRHERRSRRSRREEGRSRESGRSEGRYGDSPRDERPSGEAHDRADGGALNAGSTVAGGARYDLSRDEERGGHTLQKHVGRSDDELRARLAQERNISAASTWTNRQMAEETVGQALRAEQGKIESWQERGARRPNLALHFDAAREIGRSIRQGEANSSPCTAAVIVLKADGAGSFYVLTTYPEERR